MTTKDELAARNVCIDTRGFYPGWVKGEIGEYRFSAKVFDLPSKYGVHGGRVSKLSVYDQKKREAGADFFSACVVSYAGDMTPEEHERMVAAIDADRDRLAAVQDRIVWMKRRRAKIADDLPNAEEEPRTPETKTSRADSLRIEEAEQWEKDINT